ncbi:MAG: [protein-PII] uridylyltransferase [Alphaproteobacteria bacterium]
MLSWREGGNAGNDASTAQMDAGPRQHETIDWQALAGELDALYERTADAVTRHHAVLELVKDALATGRREIQLRFEARQATGVATVQSGAALMDRLLGLLYEAAAEHEYPSYNPTTSERLAMVASGGFGRGELAPYSDIDLLFLHPYKRTPRGEQVIEHILYLLWDLGLKVGHATRSVSECIRLARQDLTIRTALLESRFLWGDEALFQELQTAFQDQVVASTGLEFVEAKLRERDQRHKRLGDSRYVLEPNIKDGKGGLRDLQTLFWIGKYVYQVEDVNDLVRHDVLSKSAARQFDKAENFLWTVRCHLHYLSGRPEERLTFDIQPEIARRLGYTDHAGSSGVERFMKHYYLVAKDVGDLTRIFCSAIEAEHKRRPWFKLPKFGRPRNLGDFRLEGDRLDVADHEMFSRDPVAMMRLFHVAQMHELEIHPRALRLVTQNLKRVTADIRADAEANRLFVEIVTAENGSEVILRRMNEAGLFGRFLPDFGRVVGQMQHDMYHVYTVDEHTIFALGILNRIEKAELANDHPVATEVIHKVQSRRALYFGLLFHDMAKGRGANHSEIGAEMARRVCPRLGLAPEETETVSWLVRHHLAMSNTAFKRDLGDPKSIRDFVELVQSPERLRLLLCLTVADIRAVGPNVWNNWKATLLRELYHAADTLLSGAEATSDREARIAEVQRTLRHLLAGWSDAEFDAHLGRGYPEYWLAFDAETLARHARQIREAETENRPLSIETRVDRRRTVTEVTIYTQDHPGLFSRITGALAASGATVVDARIFTTPHGMALDTFWIQDQDKGPFDRPGRLARLSVLIERSLRGQLLRREIDLERTFAPRRTKVFKVEPRVLFDNSASATHTVIEVNGRDRPGFLHAVTRALYDLNVQISSAKIATYGERVVDVFYVKDGFGMKIDHETRLRRIRESLLTAIAEDEGTKAEPSDHREGTETAEPTTESTRSQATG